MKHKSILATAILVGLLLGSCSLFQKEEKDNKTRNLGLLLLLGSGSSSSSECTGSSGMVICIPKGIAE